MFADDYDDYDDFYDTDDDTDSFAPVSSGRPADLADTTEFAPVDIDGQEELPLDERINGRSTSEDDHSFDDALGVHSDDRR